MSTIAWLFYLVIEHATVPAVVVLLGGMLSPWARSAVAVGLGGAMVLLSLLAHLVVQEHVGWINYTHFGVESLAALGAVYCVFHRESKGGKAGAADGHG